MTDTIETASGARPKNTHIFAKAEGLHYVEPEWVSTRLFEVERFPGPIQDPFAGWGRVAEAARAAGYMVRATDIADRGYPLDAIENFLDIDHIDPETSIVGNPPFVDAIIQHAIRLNPVKMALIWPFARIVAAWPWLATAPLARIYMLTPRPAMPPASYVEAGKKPEGARVEHCWLVFERGHRGPAQLGWLHRDHAILAPEPDSTALAPLALASVALELGKPDDNAVDANALPHSVFGGSVAARVLRCPASVGLIQKVPENLHKKSSIYADRGTALHTAMALLLGDDPPSIDSLVGRTFDSYALTRDDIEITLRPALAYVDALLDTSGAEYYLEARIAFPTIAGAFGTADLIVRLGRTIHVIDFKFGSGVRVLALTPDGDEDVINAQLLFYAAAARHSRPAFFAGVENIVLTIVQPVTVDLDTEMVSTVTVTNAELDAFIVAYRAACENALSEAPRLASGAWCRFCPARPICPEHTRPLLDLAAFPVPEPRSAARAIFAAPPAKEDYLQALADGLNLLEAIKDIGPALRDQAKRALENGDVVPGYVLSAGRAERRWRDEIVAQVALLGLGLELDDIVELETLRSVKQVELRAKARGLKIPPELIVSARSGTSLKWAENADDPILGKDERMSLFSEALKVLQEEAKQ